MYYELKISKIIYIQHVVENRISLSCASCHAKKNNDPPPLEKKRTGKSPLLVGKIIHTWALFIFSIDMLTSRRSNGWLPLPPRNHQSPLSPGGGNPASFAKHLLHHVSANHKVKRPLPSSGSQNGVPQPLVDPPFSY